MVILTSEMHERAKAESTKREAFIQHHFEVAHLTSAERNSIGFLGEFAFSEYMGSDWKENIRPDYLTIDDCDFMLGDKKIDVKTETVPKNYAEKILNGQIDDDRAYGRRLYSQGQYNLLGRYDYIVFGMLIREEKDKWYPLGYISSQEIINNYKPTTFGPNGIKYPYPGAPIHTSQLELLSDLKNNNF